MLEYLIRKEPVFVVDNHLSDNVDGDLRLVAPFNRGEVELAFLDFFEDLLVVITIERRVSTEENVKDDTCTPYIAFFVIFASKHLWGDVKGSTCFGHKNCSCVSLSFDDIVNALLWL